MIAFFCYCCYYYYCYFVLVLFFIYNSHTSFFFCLFFYLFSYLYAFSRECHKIGVIYVGPSQDEQESILQNEKGSPNYQRFLSDLGWEIDVSKHRDFLGGLDSRSTGNISRYWSNNTTEIMFHIVTLMPSSSSDIQQIHKKRQVGNDHVHIVWSEFHRVSGLIDRYIYCIYILTHITIALLFFLSFFFFVLVLVFVYVFCFLLLHF